MSITFIQSWIAANPLLALAGTILSMIILYLIARLIFGRGLTYIATRTKNTYDDIIIAQLHPYRAAWLVPFIAMYILAYLAPTYQITIKKVALFFIIWLTALTINGLLNAFNQIYESSRSFTGVSIQGYLDIVKLLILLVAVILSISLITNESPLLLLSGLGALTAVLLFVFHDTIMALIASVQISTNDLLKEGDWVEVPAYNADGAVTNISLHMVRIRNWDKTVTVIPTFKLMETAFKNWRGMQESGGRRIKRSIRLDQTTVRFCTPQMLRRYGKIELIADFIAKRQKRINKYQTSKQLSNSPLDGPQITNLEIFRAYTEAYLRHHAEIHTDEMDFLIRELEPTPTGLPVELYVFTRTTKWNEYERIQAEIIDHLLAAAEFFDLRVFQEPAGSDFARAFQRR